MDEIDFKILKILQEDARISMRQLAGQIPMSVPAAYERVRKLEESGVIRGYGALLDPAKMGRPVNAFMTITPNTLSAYDFVKLIQDDKRVVQIRGLVGKTALMLRVSCESMDDLNELLLKLRPHCVTETYITMNEFKTFGYDFE